MDKQHIYLDFNASTPLRPSVISAMTEAMQHFGNPSSVHKYGRAARSLIENARDQMAAFFEVTPAQVVFTSGGTEANNLVIKAHPKLFVSEIEHESVDRSSPLATKIPVLSSGILDLCALEQRLSEQDAQGALVSLMLANNETGILQPVEEAASIAHRYGAKLHCDAVTAFTKISFNYKSLGADYITVSAHKIGGPKGCGAVILPLQGQINPLIHGGGQEKGHRAGTENIMGIVGFAQALQEAQRDDWEEVEQLRDLLENLILDRYPGIPFYGRDTDRLPNTSYVGMPGVATNKQLMAFDLEGFAISSGSACSSGKVTPSHVLKAMKITDQASREASRVSLGWTTKKSDVESFAETWINLYERFKQNGSA